MLEIEIIDIDLIDGGVEVFARAWKDGGQIGFGLDGSVDIERFRIFNPPILVRDPDGDIINRSEVFNPVTEVTETYVDVFREDPEEALLQALEDTIKAMKNIHDDSRIVVGKRGNTTTTIYSGGGDGCLYDNLSGGSFSTSRNASTAEGVLGGSPQWGFIARDTVYLYRAVFPFDTSSIPDTDVVSSATFSVKPQGSYNNVCSLTTYLVPITLADPTALAVGDWDGITYTDYGNKAWSLASVGTYFDMAMNATGYGAINKTGYTNLAFISQYDFLDTTPCNTTSTNGAQLYYSEATGTTDDPKLVIEHASGTTNVTASPAVLAMTFSLPASTVTAVRNVSSSPSPLALTFALQSPTVTGSASVAPSVLSATFSIPTPNILTPDSYHTVTAPLSATFSIPSSTVTAELSVTASPAVLALTFSTPAPTITEGTGVEVLPSVLSATFSIPTSTITVVSNISVTPSVLELLFTIPVARAIADFWEDKFATPSDPFVDKVYNAGDSWSDKY